MNIENILYTIKVDDQYDELVQSGNDEENDSQLSYFSFHPVSKMFAITSKKSFEVFTYSNSFDKGMGSNKIQSIYFKELPNTVVFKWNRNGE